jgi:hypothetical protein
MDKPSTTHKVELEATVSSCSSMSASLTTFVEFYTRENQRLASSIGMLLVFTGVSLAVGLDHPILGIVAGLIFGAIGLAVPQWETVVQRETIRKSN